MINKKLYKYTFLFLFVLSINYSFSQKNFEEAYLLDNSGDTIRGYIDYRNWNNNPKTIRFKDNLEADSRKITPTEIQGFGVSNEMYISAIVDIETSTEDFNKMGFNPALNLMKDTVFLQTMFRGEKSLYYYHDKDWKDNFYILKDNKLELLQYKQYLKQDGVQKYKKEVNKYKGQLILYLNDSSLLSDINRLKYRSTSFEKLFAKYYENSLKPVDYRKENDKTTVEFGVLAGVNITNFNFKSSGIMNELANAEYESSIDFTAVLFLDVILPRNLKKWSINNELSYTSYKVSGKSSTSLGQNVLNYEMEFAYSYIKMNNMLRYKYSLGKNVILFANAGFSNGFVISGENKKIRTSELSGNVKVTEAISDIRKYEQGWIGGFGSRYKKLSLEIRYETANGMSPITGFKTTVNRWFFLLGYRF